MALGFEFQTNINVWKPEAALLKIVDDSFTKQRWFYNTAFVDQLEGYCIAGRQKNQLQSHSKGKKLIVCNAGWELTADATDCEFITDPIEIDSGANGANPGFPGEERLIAQFGSMIGFCRALDGFIGKRKTKWIYSEELKGMLPQSSVTFEKSILYVQAGASNVMAFPQISSGLRLTRLRKLFRHLAKNAKTEAAALLLGQGIAEAYAATLGAVATSLKPSDLKKCVDAAGWKDHAPSAKLRGLLTLIAFYLRKGSGKYPAKVAKQFFFIMSRTDFARLFKQLNAEEQKHYRQRPAEWVDLCCNHIYKKISTEEAPGKALAPDGFLIEQKITDYGQLAEPIQIPITRKQWLTQMTAGTDLLCAAAHPKDAADANVYWEANGNSRLRGLGGLGDKMDYLVSKDLEGRAAIFEFRGPTFSNARFPYTEWTDYARKCFRFLYAVNVHEKQEKLSEEALLKLPD